ncbi:hypothetical protein MSA92_03665 [bacterium]|nr:hypothetical protein [bacterium]MDY2885327.1 hypothetical protein [Bariatricus sp.]
MVKYQFIEKMFEDYIHRLRYNHSVASDSQDGIYSAGEIAVMEKWLKHFGVDLNYFRIQAMLEGKEKIQAYPDGMAGIETADICVQTPKGKICMTTANHDYPGMVLDFQPDDSETDFEFSAMMEWNQEEIHTVVWDGKQEDPIAIIPYGK